MFTVCPKCALTLHVTAEDLRVAQGYVRCGRCSNVFNALARLSEERPGAVAAPVPTPPPPPAPAAPPASVALPPPAPASPQPLPERDAEAISDSALEFNPDATDVTAVFVETRPDPAWLAATDSFKSLSIASESAAAASSDQKQEPGELARASRGDPSQVDVELDADFLSAAVGGHAMQRELREQPPQRDLTARADLEAPPASLPPTPRSSTEPAAAAGRTLVFGRLPPAAPPSAAPSASSHALLFRVGSGVLLLLLLTQVLTHYRDQLAAQPAFNGPLTRLYGALGITVMPRWDLRAYEVRQLGATADPSTASTITVRASVKNGAPHAQPLPLLQVVLEDRFGNRIAARDVPPAVYLRGAGVRTALGAGERIDAEVSFVDPGSNAVGFELDACLPQAGGSVTCANDAAKD